MMTNGTQHTERGGTRRGWLIVAAVVVVVVLVSAFVSLRPRRIRVTVTAPTRQEISSSITTNGKVEPVKNFEVRALQASAVRRVLVREGQKVRKDQLLVVLDDSDARAQLARAVAQLRAAEARASAIREGGTREEILTTQADLANARAELESANRNLQAIERLQRKGAASQDEITAAQARVTRAQTNVRMLEQKSGSRFSAPEQVRASAEVEDARAQVAAAQHLINEANIRAPFDGTVYGLPAREGSWVSAGDPVVQVADLSGLQVRAFVDEPEIGRLKPDQPVRITWDALPGQSWEGRVLTLPATVVARGNRNVGEMLCSVNNNDGRLLPNTNVGVTVLLSSNTQALTVPREAVRQDNGKSHVYVVNGSHIERRAVETGVANLTQIQITNGLKDNDVIAVQSLSPTPLTDGITVKIVENQ